MSRCYSRMKIPFEGDEEYIYKVNSPPQFYMEKGEHGNIIFSPPDCPCNCGEGDSISTEKVMVVSEHRIEQGLGEYEFYNIDR